jgi:hypothetical protein
VFVPLHYKLLVGAIAGVTSGALVFPLDFIKTRLQNATTRVGLVELIRNVYSKSGIRGFYQGAGTVLGAAPEKSLKLAVNEQLLDYLAPDRSQVTVRHQLVAGAGAGFAQVIVSCPLEVVKQQLQMMDLLVQRGTLPRRLTISEIVQKLGVRGMYTGLFATVLRDVPYNLWFFPTYYFVQSSFSSHAESHRKLIAMISGMSAGVVAASMATPADVIKSRLQILGSPYKTWLACAMATWREDGLRTLFKGATMRAAVQGPQYAVALMAFETLRDYVKSQIERDRARGLVTSQVLRHT